MAHAHRSSRLPATTALAALALLLAAPLAHARRLRQDCPEVRKWRGPHAHAMLSHLHTPRLLRHRCPRAKAPRSCPPPRRRENIGTPPWGSVLLPTPW